ncbi:hypothetical protein ACFQJD_06180 [Haloplanus sp. GCM10025708]|uniref:hypothetical protein n=1 Tax=Haloferacaceae TaxID=1644056 RepID=UPI003612D912
MTDDAPSGSDDPTTVVSIAVRSEDVVTALESTLRSSQRTVLRVTPPFSGRMRARLHRPSNGDAAESPNPIHVGPETLVEEIPPYPELDDTEDRLRREGAYSTEAHRDAHVTAVEAWRDAVRDAIVDVATVETPNGPHRVEVDQLG